MKQIKTELSGLDFNIHHKNTKTKFYKFLHDNLIHNEFEYKLGLNVDTVPFNPNGTCSKGGLYFCEESKCHMYWSFYGQKLAVIEIPNDARVYIEEDKFKADKIIITKIINFEDVEDRFWINILPHSSDVLDFIKKSSSLLTEDMQNMILEREKEKRNSAVQQNGYALKHVQDQTDWMCKLAVEQNGLALECVKDQTDMICQFAVSQNGLALEHVKDQTDMICQIAVSQNGLALEHVIYQSEWICQLAVSQNGLALEHVKDHFLTEEICKLAVAQNSLASQYVKKPSDLPTESICVIC